MMQKIYIHLYDEGWYLRTSRLELVAVGGVVLSSVHKEYFVYSNSDRLKVKVSKDLPKNIKRANLINNCRQQ